MTINYPEKVLNVKSCITGDLSMLKCENLNFVSYCYNFFVDWCSFLWIWTSLIKQYKCSQLKNVTVFFKKNQWIIIKLVVKSRRKGMQILSILNVFKDLTTKKSAVHEWIAGFKAAEKNDNAGCGEHIMLPNVVCFWQHTFLLMNILSSYRRVCKKKVTCPIKKMQLLHEIAATPILTWGVCTALISVWVAIPFSFKCCATGVVWLNIVMNLIISCIEPCSCWIWN